MLFERGSILGKMFSSLVVRVGTHALEITVIKLTSWKGVKKEIMFCIKKGKEIGLCELIQ